jgi:hypothetical protein
VCVMLAGTCGKFTQKNMIEMLMQFKAWGDERITPIFSVPPCGIGSDGCSAGVPFQWRFCQMWNHKGEHVSVAEGFVSYVLHRPATQMQASRDIATGRLWGIRPQDMKQDMKKTTGSGTSASREPQLGIFFISLDNVLAMFRREGEDAAVRVNAFVKSVQSDKKYMTQSKAENAYRMNVEESLSFICLQAQHVLQTKQHDLGTYFFVRVLWEFRKLFDAIFIPVETRLVYRGRILTFFFGWHR